MDSSSLRERLEFYCKQTNVRGVNIPRHEGWSEFGLPDLRGFTPQLRRVNLFKDQTFSFENWIIHDLLHILFYDFVALNLGTESWLERERFFENHLASEAFAVLALDYHVLAYEKGGETLTVDLKAADWKAFQSINPELPNPRSQDMCELLVEHYLTGRPGALEAEKPNAKYESWLGHEIRYATKQRTYVAAWWDDLMNSESSRIAVEIQGSAVHEAVWELLQLLLYSNDKTWKNYVSEIHAYPNAFEGFPKIKSPPSRFDFRFTDITALLIDELGNALEKTKKPSASGLFLCWQLLSLQNPKRGELIERIAVDAQTNSISQADWDSLKELAYKSLADLDQAPNLDRIATFFLP